MGRKANTIDAKEVCRMYSEETIGVEALATKFHVGKAKIKQILAENGISIKKRGAQVKNTGFIVPDWSMKKYEPKNGFHYVAIDRKTGFRTNDFENRAGVLTTHISKEYGVEIPTLYDRRMYYMRTGNYWWEQWFDILLEKDAEVKKCPYCDWVTIDIENRSGMFETHLRKEHGMTKIQYINEHPEDSAYFSLSNPTLNMRLFETDENKFITCAVCGEKMVRMTEFHAKQHGMTKSEYGQKYGFDKTVSKSFSEQMSRIATEANMNMSFEKNSKGETELREFIESLGFTVKNDRKILHGKELDMLVEEKNMAIEYDGLFYHNEISKPKDYHLKKTEDCEAQGVKLIHVFEDEWLSKQNIVKSRIKSILGVTETKIYARKCILNEIDSETARTFMNENHLQGYATSSYRYGLFFNGELVSVMTFGKKRKALGEKTSEGEYELIRMANKMNCYVVGGASKLLKYFIKTVHPTKIISFCDRRWSDGHLYEKLGFEFIKNTTPGYFYVVGNKRVHRFSFRKDILVSRYGCPPTMTEHEFCLSKKWYRIYDCGNKRYELAVGHNNDL